MYKRQPLLNPVFAQRWFGWPGIVMTSPVPILVALLALGFWRGLATGAHLSPFLCALGWFALCFAGLGISLYPYIVPPGVTIWDAAAPPASQAFLLVDVYKRQTRHMPPATPCSSRWRRWTRAAWISNTTAR